MLKKAFHPPFECLRVSGTHCLTRTFPLMLRLSKHERVHFQHPARRTVGHPGRVMAPRRPTFREPR